MIAEAAENTLLFLIRTLPVVIAASLAISYAAGKGYLDRLTDAAKPLLGKLGISSIAVASVAACFVSPTASYSMLSQAWKEGKVGEREVIAISFVNSLPSTISHAYTFYIPFVIPVLGFAGIVYTATRFVSATIRSAIGIALARKWSDGSEAVPARISFRMNIARTAFVMAATYFAVNLLLEFVNVAPLTPNAAITIAGLSVVNVRAAIVSAAALLEKGLDWRWVVAGLLLGNVVTLSARAFRHSLPFHVALFGRLGVKIVALNALASLLIDVCLVVVIFNC